MKVSGNNYQTGKSAEKEGCKEGMVENSELINKELATMQEKTDIQSLKKIRQLEEQYKILLEAFAKKEQENLILIQENKTLIQSLKELTNVYNNLTLKFENTENHRAPVKNEHTNATKDFLTDKNKQIENLKSEIREINARHLNTITDLAQKNDESFMRERVKNNNLNNTVKELQQHIKMVEERLGAIEAENLPLQKKIKKQKAIIDKFVTWEQLKNFIHHVVEDQE